MRPPTLWELLLFSTHGPDSLSQAVPDNPDNTEMRLVSRHFLSPSPWQNAVFFYISGTSRSLKVVRDVFIRSSATRFCERPKSKWISHKKQAGLLTCHEKKCTSTSRKVTDDLSRTSGLFTGSLQAPFLTNNLIFISSKKQLPKIRRDILAHSIFYQYKKLSSSEN